MLHHGRTAIRSSTTEEAGAHMWPICPKHSHVGATFHDWNAERKLSVSSCSSKSHFGQPTTKCHSGILPFYGHFVPPCPCTNLKPCCVAAIYTQGDQVCPSASQPTVPSHGQLQDGSHEGHEGHEGPSDDQTL